MWTSERLQYIVSAAQYSICFSSNNTSHNHAVSCPQQALKVILVRHGSFSLSLELPLHFTTARFLFLTTQASRFAFSFALIVSAHVYELFLIFFPPVSLQTIFKMSANFSYTVFFVCLLYAEHALCCT